MMRWKYEEIRGRKKERNTYRKIQGNAERSAMIDREQDPWEIWEDPGDIQGDQKEIQGPPRQETQGE
jgi:hypothetical protein